jgi:hypothetical protein
MQRTRRHQIVDGAVSGHREGQQEKVNAGGDGGGREKIPERTGIPANCASE